MTELTMTPFSKGSQYADWQDMNCCRCVKYVASNQEDQCCPIEWVLSIASIGDGTIPLSIARRMHAVLPDGSENGNYVWPCGELEPLEGGVA